MAFHQESIGASRVRRLALTITLVLVVASAIAPISAAGSGTALCCSDEWQIVGICATGQRIASYCDDSTCQQCGSWFCYTETRFQACYH